MKVRVRGYLVRTIVYEVDEVVDADHGTSASDLPSIDVSDLTEVEETYKWEDDGPEIEPVVEEGE
jgi:hypothetical protein